MSRPLAHNAMANILQMIASAVLLFILYRYINARLGTAALGVWSVVLATVSASRLATFGLGASVTRFVALYLARSRPDDAGQVIQTASLTLMVLLGLVLPLLYDPFHRLLPHLFDGQHLAQARSLLPYSLVALWFAISAAVFQSAFDGCQRMDLRAGLMIGGQVLMLAVALWLVPRLGLVGLAWAQIVQGLFLLIGGWLLLRRVLVDLPWAPWYWSWGKLREMLGYGTNVQATGVLMMLFDPVTKALMARFGGAEAAGYFEMANQVVLKVRSVIVAANQAVVPKVAELVETSPERMHSFYKRNMRILTFVALPTFALLLVWSGAVSWLLLGRVESEFIALIHAAAAGWFVNLFGVPAYFDNLGRGSVGWNTLSHATTGVINGALGWWLGSNFGAEGIAWAYALALMVGSAVLVLVYQIREAISLRALGLQVSTAMAIASAIAVTVSNWLWAGGLGDDPLLLCVSAIGLSLVVAGATWFHPSRREIWAWASPVLKGMRS
ncbi:MAG TPA: hypothetical protein ENK35_09285 [Candidatus Tenderia sp.]|nr:hypothetical protein [Candidatus Tenderia sp.]